MAASCVKILTHSVMATVALAQYRAVTAAGTIPPAGGRCLGVADFSAAPGERVSIGAMGTVIGEAGGAFSVDAALELDATGRFIAAVSGTTVGRSITAAAGAGSKAEVLLIHGSSGGGGPAATVPGQPAKPVLTAMAGAVSVAWTAGAAGSTATTGNTWTDINGIVTQLTTNPQVISGLPADVPYTGTVTTRNAQGPGPASAQADAVTPTSVTGNNVDVLVYDPTMAGIASALRSKAEGVSVMVVAPRSHIGGVPTGAVQFADVYSTTKYKATIPESSFYNRLMEAQASAYSLNSNQFYHSSARSESKTTRAIVMQWLADAGITVILNSPLVSVTMVGDPNNGGSPSDLTFAGLGKVNVKQVIDTSYQGVVGLLGGVTTAAYMGAEPTTLYGEGEFVGGYTVAGAQPAAFVDPYVIPGDATSGLIKFVQPEALQTPGSEFANRVQYPGFRLSITNVAGKKLPFPEPDNYNAADYEVYRRDILANKQSAVTVSSFLNLQQGTTQKPVGPIFSTTPGMTNKRDANQNGIFGIDYPDPVGNAAYYLLPTEAERIAYENNVKQFTLGLLKFWRTDSSVPAAVRADFANWGLCNDDYLDTGGFPPIMYPREGRRYKAANTITGFTTFRQNTSATPVALSIAYAADSHPMSYQVSPSGGGPHVVQVGSQASNAAHSTLAARIPLAILDSSMGNVQTPWAPNCSRVAYNTIRLEPVVCTYAEAAGIRAALAVKNGTTLAAVPYAQIALKQNLYGLDPAVGSVVTADGTTRTAGTFTTSGTWALTTVAANNICGSGFVSCTQTTGVHSFTAAPTPIGPGNWKLQLKYIDHNGSDGTQDRGTISVVVKGNGVNQAAQVIDQLSSRADVLTNGDWQTVYTGPWVAGDNVVGTYDNSGKGVNIVAARIVPT